MSVDWEEHERRATVMSDSLNARRSVINRMAATTDRRVQAWEDYYADMGELLAYLRAIQSRDAEALALVGTVYGPDVIGQGGAV